MVAKTLDGLVKECGHWFGELKRAELNGYGWVWTAKSMPAIDGKHYITQGKTPREALSRLANCIKDPYKTKNSLR